LEFIADEFITESFVNGILNDAAKGAKP